MKLSGTFWREACEKQQELIGPPIEQNYLTEIGSTAWQWKQKLQQDAIKASAIALGIFKPSGAQVLVWVFILKWPKYKKIAVVKYSGSGRFCKRSPYICRVRSVSGWPRATAATEHEKKPELCWTECKCIWRNEKFPVASFFIYRGTSVSALVHQEKLMLIFRQKTWGFVFPSEIFLCSSWILPL